jgi:S-sulfo-L-cysteine synthase (3-phospho-L-serine-dependent)
VLSDLDEIVLANPFDQTTILARLKLIDERHPLDLVYTMLDPNLLDVCVASAAMGKPALHWKKAAVLRNKFAVRSALRDAGISQPAFRAVSNWVELRAAVDDIGYPCVLKPVDAFGSVAVSFLRCQADVDEAGQFLAPQKLTGSRHSSGNHILERFLDGPQISVETVFLNGANHCYAIVDKRFNRDDVAAELGGTVCSPRDPRFAAAVDHAMRCLDALGYDFGFAHVEIILTADGPAVVEINPRMIGGVMSQVLEAALGVNPFMLLLQSLAGASLDNLPRPTKAAGIFWVTSPREGVLDTITLPPATGQIVRAETIVERGARVAPPLSNNDRLGFVIVEAETDEALLATVALARSQVDVRVV